MSEALWSLPAAWDDPVTDDALVFPREAVGETVLVHAARANHARRRRA